MQLLSYLSNRAIYKYPYSIVCKFQHDSRQIKYLIRSCLNQTRKFSRSYPAPYSYSDFKDLRLIFNILELYLWGLLWDYQSLYLSLRRPYLLEKGFIS